MSLFMDEMKKEFDRWTTHATLEEHYRAGAWKGMFVQDTIMTKADFDEAVREFRIYAFSKIPMDYEIKAYAPFSTKDSWGITCQPITGGGWGARTFSFDVRVRM